MTEREYEPVDGRGQTGYFLEERRFTEKDWKLFRKKIPIWQEAYMDRLNKEYIELLSEDEKASDKFWRLNKKIKKDERKTGVIADMRRSRLIYNILSLIDEGVIKFEDLEEFSDELKEAVGFFEKR